MRTPLLAILLALALGQSACETPIKAHHEYDTSAPFGEYGTYAWVTDQPLILPQAGVSARDPRISPVIDGIVRSAVERTLQAKGYQKLDDPASADLVVSFTIGAREKIRVNSYPARAGYRYGPYHGGAWQTDVRQYTEGMLAVDLFDTKTRQAVWHGWATKRISSTTDAENRRANLNEAVNAILGDFPLRNAMQ